MSSSILIPTRSNLYSDTDLEPQMVQIRQKNSAYLFLESQSSLLELTKEDMLLSSIKQLGDQPNILAQNIKRLSISSVGVNWVIPNVNPRNNNIQFISSNTGATIYSVFIPEGNYQTSSALIGAIILAMNSVSGSSGLTFSSVPVSLRPDLYNLNSAGGSYGMVLTCNAITKGKQCYAFPEDASLSTSKRIGNMMLLYTQYIDFCSSKLSGYTKLPNKTNGPTNCVLQRVYLFSKTLGTEIPLFGPYFYSTSNISGINFNFGDSLSLIDFKLYDQNGDLLYVPTDGGCTGGQCGFNWDMQILIEF